MTLEDPSQHTFIGGPGKNCAAQGEEGKSRCPLGTRQLQATSPCCELSLHPAGTSQWTVLFSIGREWNKAVKLRALRLVYFISRVSDFLE